MTIARLMLEAQLRNADPETRYLYEERAGIIEFCGNVPREVAEQEAAKQVFGVPVASPSKENARKSRNSAESSCPDGMIVPH